MELQETAVSIQVAQLESLSKVARQLGHFQVAATTQIKQPEQELSVHPFDCIGKQTTLTHQRVPFYERAVSVIKEPEHARDAVTCVSELTGNLCLGTIEPICTTIFPELLREYHRLYPRVNIRLTTDSSEILLEMMSSNAIGIVYLLDKCMYDSKWIKALEEPEGIVFVTTLGHPFAGRDSLGLGQVIGQPFTLTERSASYRSILGQYLAAKGREMHPLLEIGNAEFIINLLRKNLDASLLPEFIVHRDIISGELAVLDVRDSYMRTWCQIVHHKDKWVIREMNASIRPTRS